ncbi:MAG: hypothetical protein KAI99_21660, partial [Cyclobacteriaceae bacterium]|nr:hypothetical protein [Cyclobacteriaceae bacterium]
AQAREAQIEAALERVRSRAMAMHNSSDLPSTASVVFTELRKLGIETMRSGISIHNKENRKILLYTATKTKDGDELSVVGWAVLDNHPVLSQIYDSWILGEDYFPELRGKLLKTYYEQIESSFKVPKEQSETEQYGYFISFTHGIFYGWSKTPFEESERQILKRFASVVDLTFKRYFDLQKAEAQAREAQIEVSLERVRSRTMAMHKSEELAETAAALFQQFNKLGVNPERMNIGIVKEDKRIVEFWSTEQGGKKIDRLFKSTIDEPTTISKMYAAWKAGKKSIVVDLTGDELAAFLIHLKKEIGLPFKDELIHKRRVHSASFFSQGMILMSTPEPLSDETLSLMPRFATVFEQTYTRFLDLQKAEAQAREAEIEAALERIRSKAMAMHTSDDLISVADTLREQMGKLGQPGLDSSGIHFYD